MLPKGIAYATLFEVIAVISGDILLKLVGC
jgi:hypothetical protein